MWPNPQFPTDLVTFTEEIFNGKLHFLYSDINEVIKKLYADVLHVANNFREEHLKLKKTHESFSYHNGLRNPGNSIKKVNYF